MIKQRHSKYSLFILIFIFCQQAYGKPLVIAHRGASGYLPEHTIAAATLAFSQGADYIEQDIVMSKDGILIVLHDIHLETVTNVEQVYPKRARSDGRYYVIDFTLEELRRLRVHERQNSEGKQVFPNRFTANSYFGIATFEEHIQLISELNRKFNKQVGLYPEIKSPAWHRAQGVDISKAVLTTLRKYQLDDATKAVYLQCFDFNEIKRLRLELNAQVKIIQLIGDNSWQESTTDYQWLQTSQGIKQVSQYVQGIGPWLPQLFNFQTKAKTPLVTLAKSNNLMIHPFTHRSDQLPENTTNKQLFTLLFKQLQIDGLFTDFTPEVVSYLDSQQ